MPDNTEIASQPSVEALSKYQLISIAKIKPSRHQARKQFDENGIKALAESIRQEGLIEPIVVRQIGDEFELVSGERRLRACKLIGLESIEAKVIQIVSEAESAAKGMIENLQRQDLTPLEEAQGFQDILDLKDSHWNQEQIAKVSGKSPAYVSLSLRLLKLPSYVLNKFRARNLSRSHGLELIRLSTEQQQMEAIDAIESNKLNWEDTRKLVDGMLGPGKKKAKKKGAEGKSASGLQFKLEGDRLAVSGSIPFQPVAGAVIAAADQFRELLSAWMGKTGRGEEDVQLLAARKGPAALCAKVLGAEDSRTKLLEGKSWADFGIKSPEDGLKAFKNGDITERR